MGCGNASAAIWLECMNLCMQYAGLYQDHPAGFPAPLLPSTLSSHIDYLAGEASPSVRICVADADARLYYHAYHLPKSGLTCKFLAAELARVFVLYDFPT